MDISKSLIRGADPSWRGRLTLNCRFQKAVEYVQSIVASDLDDRAAYKLVATMPFSRYIGKLVISDRNGLLFHILVDATETDAKTAVLAFVAFRHLHATVRYQVAKSAELFGVELIDRRRDRAVGSAP